MEEGCASGDVWDKRESRNQNRTNSRLSSSDGCLVVVLELGHRIGRLLLAVVVEQMDLCREGSLEFSID